MRALAGQGFTASQTGNITGTNNTATVASLVCNTTPTYQISIQYQLDSAAAGPAVGGLTSGNFNLTATGVTDASISSVAFGLGGTAMITVTVTDSVGAPRSMSFVLTESDTVDVTALDGLTDLLIFRDTTARSDKKKNEDCSTGDGAGIALLAALLALVALTARRARRA